MEPDPPSKRISWDFPRKWCGAIELGSVIGRRSYDSLIDLTLIHKEGHWIEYNFKSSRRDKGTYLSGVDSDGRSYEPDRFGTVSMPDKVVAYLCTKALLSEDNGLSRSELIDLLRAVSICLERLESVKKDEK